jgi:hypothetical protein
LVLDAGGDVFVRRLVVAERVGEFVELVTQMLHAS